MQRTGRVSRALTITHVTFTFVGILLSIYAYHVETNVHSDPTFKALCDISEKMSCTKVFSSRYGTGFGLVEHVLGKDSAFNQPNSVYGVVFYVIMMALALNTSYGATVAQLVVAFSGGLGCLYLAYILIFILDDFCVVCVSTYTVNAILIICSLVKFKSVRGYEQSKREKNSKKKAS